MKYLLYFLTTIILTSVFTIIYGIFLGVLLSTSIMVLEIGLVVVVPVSLLNVIFLFLAGKLDLLYLKRITSYLPIVLFIVYIIRTPLNIAWIGLTLIFSLILVNTYWNFQIQKH